MEEVKATDKRYVVEIKHWTMENDIKQYVGSALVESDKIAYIEKTAKRKFGDVKKVDIVDLNGFFTHDTTMYKRSRVVAVSSISPDKPVFVTAPTMCGSVEYRKIVEPIVVGRKAKLILFDNTENPELWDVEGDGIYFSDSQKLAEHKEWATQFYRNMEVTYIYRKNGTIVASTNDIVKLQRFKRKYSKK